MSLGKAEKTDKTGKLPRDRTKALKEKDIGSETGSDSCKSDGDTGRSISPKNKKKRGEIVSSGVRFDSSDQRGREKVNSRSSSAGPVSSSADLDASKGGMDEADMLLVMFRDFTSRMSGSLGNVVRKNHELSSQVSLLLKAAQSEEPPFEAMVRQKEALSREYDQLRYEHQVLQKEFQQIRRENLELVAENQDLQAELSTLKAGIGAPSSPRLASAAASVAVAPTTLPSPLAIPNNIRPKSPARQARDEITSSANSASSCNSQSEGSGLVSLSPTPLVLKRRDNFAELEQSILAIEEEIRSPRSSSPSNSPRSPNGKSQKSDAGPKKRKVLKSHSNELPNAQNAVVSSASSSSTSSTPSSARVKSPPERAISAPSEVKKTDVVSRSSSSSSNNSIGAHHSHTPTPVHTAGTTSSSSSIPVSTSTAGKFGHHVSSAQSKASAEEREQQRLSKYTAGPRRNNKARNSSPPSPNHLTPSEQITFTHIFRKWDNDDDDLIDRHELELTLDSMSQNENLKELHAIVQPHFSKIAWDTLSLGKGAHLSLGAALTFLSDCKIGAPNPQVFANPNL